MVLMGKTVSPFFLCSFSSNPFFLLASYKQEKWCLHFFMVVLDPILLILAKRLSEQLMSQLFRLVCNENMHDIFNELKFQPDFH